MYARVKICGIRSETDLRIAVDAGADAVGLICGITHVSEDALESDHARALARQAPPFVSTVLVTHLEAARDVLDLAEDIGVDTIQLHGLMARDQVAEVKAHAGGRRVVRAVHVAADGAIDDALELRGLCDAVLLDSRTADRLGGTGQTHDWSISRRIRGALEGQVPVILAGGLRPENVREAVSTVRPYAVDVNSGVEDQSGDKDPSLCSAFVSSARAGVAQ